MADLIARFRTSQSPIWTRRGIKQIGYWTVVVGESHNDLIYLLGRDSLADRESTWSTFCGDAEWAAACRGRDQRVVNTVVEQSVARTDGISALQ
jgi:hypothetical protein